MKLIVTGATGFVASEIIRQSLRRPEIKTVIAIARKPVSAPEGTDAAKLKSIIVEDYTIYSEDVRKEFAGASACIWTVAITPSKSMLYNIEDVRRVCHTSTIAGLKAMYEAGPAKPFRFLYMSGFGVDRDPNFQPKVPSWMLPYFKIRVSTENDVFAFAEEHKEDMEACTVRSGLITSQVTIARSLVSAVLKWTNAGNLVTLEEISAAVVDQAINGFKAETLLNADLVEIGQNVLQTSAQH